jgi:simple sugar transport system ATP-binding protein
VREGARIVGKGLEERDEAVRHGAEAAMVLIYRTGRVLMPELEDVTSHYPHFSEKITSTIKPVHAKASTLSGGNLQRLIVARELFANPGRQTPVLLLASYPAKGLDVAATDYVRRLILSVRDSGAAVILLSDDLEELIALSDRIGVMYKGELLAVLEKERAEIETIGMLMMGVRPGDS